MLLLLLLWVAASCCHDPVKLVVTQICKISFLVVVKFKFIYGFTGAIFT